MNTKVTVPPLADTIASMKADIARDMHNGIVPSDVSSFAALHDYVDANEYGGFCEDGLADAMIEHFGGRDEHEGMPQGMLDYINEAQAAVDQWLKAGGLNGAA